MKPAVKTRPHHGVADPVNSTNSYKINRYQQTWHTIEFSNNRHTRHHHNPISVADRSGATFQTYPIPDHYANRRFRHPQAPQEGSPPGFRTPVKTPFFRPFRRGRSLSFRISGGDSNYFTRPEDPAQIHPRTVGLGRKPAEFRGFPADLALLGCPTAPKRLMWTESQQIRT